jgi:hypothetical protein
VSTHAADEAIRLNRAALILRYNRPFLGWINAVDPSPTSHTLDLAEVNAEHTVYLVEVEDEDELVTWLAQHHQELFDRELLWSWYTDPALWPKDRSLTMLQAWRSIELHTVVVDTGQSMLEDDDLD